MKFTIPFMIITLLLLTSCGWEDTTTQQEDTPSVQVEDVMNDFSEEDWEDILTPNWDSMPVQAWDTIRVHYTGTFEDGTIFDTSRERDETLDFTVGAWQMIQGFDEWVVGMTQWETKTFTLTPDLAYGERNEDLIEVIQREELQDFVNAGIPLEIGSQLPTQFGILTIIETDETTVTVDLNNPMAWKTLTFEVELVEIVK